MNDTLIELEIDNGIRLCLPDTLACISTYVLTEQGTWFEKEVAFLERLIQPGMVVLDVGANYGVYALQCARRVGPTGRVHAFEPASQTRAALLRARGANGPLASVLEVWPQALSNAVGQAQLGLGASSELNALVRDAAGAQGGKRENVELTTLDLLLNLHQWRAVDFIKIDAEGEELRIIAGGERFFGELSPLVMFEVKAGAQADLSVAAKFREIGYGIYRLNGSAEFLMPFDEAEALDAYELNLFAAKPACAQRLATLGLLVESVARYARREDARQHAQHWFEARPYWRQFGFELRSADAEYLAGLEAYAHFATRVAGEDAAYRLGALHFALAAVREAAGRSGRIEHLASLIRIAHDAGERAVAVAASSRLLQAVAQGAHCAPPEPFLPPVARLDEVPARVSLDTWLTAAAVEYQERFSAYSSLYQSVATLPGLRWLCDSGAGDESLARRLLLRSLRAGLLVNQDVARLREFAPTPRAHGATATALEFAARSSQIA